MVFNCAASAVFEYPIFFKQVSHFVGLGNSIPKSSRIERLRWYALNLSVDFCGDVHGAPLKFVKFLENVCVPREGSVFKIIMHQF